MGKIRDLVQINSGYTSYVDLYEEYYDELKNRERMRRYKPIKAHRLAFEKIANALNPLDRRFYFLSGSYGTGKSHLLLMLANYFAHPSDVPEIEEFFKNYETAQKEVFLRPGESLNERSAQSLKDARKSGRYLVAICRYGLNLDFEATLLRALEEALQKEDQGLILDSHYREALRKIQNWESRRHTDRFFADLETVLQESHAEWTISRLKEGLAEYNPEALNVFKDCFRKVTDTDFRYNQDNLRDIISDFLSNNEFKQKYKGIVFLFDEFGAAIDDNLVRYPTLLDFAQFCANSSLERDGEVIFVGAGHKGFRHHGKLGDLNAETLEARVTEVGLQTQGMEDIISAIVQPRKDASEWKQYVENSSKFTQFSSECARLKLFSWLSAPKVKNLTLNTYPMHPLATFALIRLAGEAGSDNRSVFKFFSPEFDTGEQGWVNVQPYSYPWFVENHDVTKEGELSLYTADLLVDYFKDSLKSNNTRLTERVKNAVVNYETTIRELNAYLARENQQNLFDDADDLILRIIKVMLVNEIISSPETTIPNTLKNIAFALDIPHTEQVERRLKLLCEANIIFKNGDVYELIRGDRIDVHHLIEQYKAVPENRPTHLHGSFLQWVKMEEFLDAREYNSTYQEDKRLKVVFATPEMLAEESIIDGKIVSFFERLERDRISAPRSKGYEGTAVYVFCENEQDIDTAKRAVAKNDQPRVVVAVPRYPKSIFDAIFTLKALESDFFKRQAEKFSPYEHSQVKQIKDKVLQQLEEVKNYYFNNANVIWFEKSGIEVPVQGNLPHAIANRLMSNLFTSRRNTISHIDFNKIHINVSSNPGIRKALKEAGDVLCDLSQRMKINFAWAENLGPIKYLRKCFVDHQILRIVENEGDIRYLEVEKDIEKFRTKLPAYAHLLESLANLEGKDPVHLRQFLKPYFDDFGQGEIAVTLMLLLARRFYGDSLRFKREPGALTDIQLQDTEDMLNLVQGQSPSAVILFEPISDEEKNYFAKVAQIFSEHPAPAGKTYTIGDAYQAITSWWEKLPPVDRALELYPDKFQPLAEAVGKARTQDPFYFVKHELLQLLGQNLNEVLTSERLANIEAILKDFKATAEAIQSQMEQKILEKVAEIFHAQSALDVDIQEALRDWYNGLSSIQKDPLASFHNNDSKPLIKYPEYTNIRELLFKKLPEAYGIGSVEIWQSNFVHNYTQRIASGKKHIEQNVPQIGQLKIEFQNAVSQKGNQVTYKGELIVHVDTEDGKGTIYYTEDGSDPANSPRAKRLSPGETITLKGNQKIKLTVADEQGKYGAVQSYEVIDELQKFKISHSSELFEQTVRFCFPVDQHSARITLRSLLEEMLRAKIYDKEQLRRDIEQLLNDLPNSDLSNQS